MLKVLVVIVCGILSLTFVFLKPPYPKKVEEDNSSYFSRKEDIVNVTCSCPEDFFKKWKRPIVWQDCQDRLGLIPPAYEKEWVMKCGYYLVPLKYSPDGSYHENEIPISIGIRRLTRWKDHRRKTIKDYKVLKETILFELARVIIEYDNLSKLQEDDAYEFYLKAAIKFYQECLTDKKILTLEEFRQLEREFMFYLRLDGNTNCQKVYHFSVNMVNFQSINNQMVERLYEDNTSIFVMDSPELYLTTSIKSDASFTLLTSYDIDEIFNLHHPTIQKYGPELVFDPIVDPSFFNDIAHAPTESYEIELIEYPHIYEDMLRKKNISMLFDAPQLNSNGKYCVRFHKMPLYEEDIPKAYNPNEKFNERNKFKKYMFNLENSKENVKTVTFEDLEEGPDVNLMNNTKKTQYQPPGLHWNLFEAPEAPQILFRNGRFYRRKAVPCPRLHLWLLEGGFEDDYITTLLIDSYGEAIKEPFHIFIPEYRGSSINSKINMYNLTSSEQLLSLMSDEIPLKYLNLDYASFDVLNLIERINELYPRPDTRHFIHASGYNTLWAQRVMAFNSTHPVGLILDSPLTPYFEANEVFPLAEMEVLRNLYHLCSQNKYCSSWIKNESEFDNILNTILKENAQNECLDFMAKSLVKASDTGNEECSRRMFVQECIVSHLINLGSGYLNTFAVQNLLVDFRMIAIAFLYKIANCRTSTDLNFFRIFFLNIYPYMNENSKMNQIYAKYHVPLFENFSKPDDKFVFPVLRYYLLFKEFWNHDEKDFGQFKEKWKFIPSLNFTLFENLHIYKNLFDFDQLEQQALPLRLKNFKWSQFNEFFSLDLKAIPVELSTKYSEYYPTTWPSYFDHHKDTVHGGIFYTDQKPSLLNFYNGSDWYYVINPHLPTCKTPNSRCHIRFSGQRNISTVEVNRKRDMACICCTEEMPQWSRPLVSKDYKNVPKDIHQKFYYEQVNYPYKLLKFKNPAFHHKERTPKAGNPAPHDRKYVKAPHTRLLLIHGSMNTLIPASQAQLLFKYGQFLASDYYEFWRGGHHVLSKSRSCTNSILNEFFSFTHLPWNPKTIWPVWLNIMEDKTNEDVIKDLAKRTFFDYFEFINERSLNDYEGKIMSSSPFGGDIIASKDNNQKIKLKRNVYSTIPAFNSTEYLRYRGLDISKGRIKFSFPDHLSKLPKCDCRIVSDKQIGSSNLILLKDSLNAYAYCDSKLRLYNTSLDPLDYSYYERTNITIGYGASSWLFIRSSAIIASWELPLQGRNIHSPFDIIHYEAQKSNIYTNVDVIKYPFLGLYKVIELFNVNRVINDHIQKYAIKLEYNNEKLCIYDAYDFLKRSKRNAYLGYEETCDNIHFVKSEAIKRLNWLKNYKNEKGIYQLEVAQDICPYTDGWNTFNYNHTDDHHCWLSGFEERDYRSLFSVESLLTKPTKRKVNTGKKITIKDNEYMAWVFKNNTGPLTPTVYAFIGPKNIIDIIIAALKFVYFYLTKSASGPPSCSTFILSDIPDDIPTVINRESLRTIQNITIELVFEHESYEVDHKNHDYYFYSRNEISLTPPDLNAYLSDYSFYKEKEAWLEPTVHQIKAKLLRNSDVPANRFHAYSQEKVYINDGTFFPYMKIIDETQGIHGNGGEFSKFAYWCKSFPYMDEDLIPYTFSKNSDLPRISSWNLLEVFNPRIWNITKYSNRFAKVKKPTGRISEWSIPLENIITKSTLPDDLYYFYYKTKMDGAPRLSLERYNLCYQYDWNQTALVQVFGVVDSLFQDYKSNDWTIHIATISILGILILIACMLVLRRLIRASHEEQSSKFNEDYPSKNSRSPSLDSGTETSPSDHPPLQLDNKKSRSKSKKKNTIFDESYKFGETIDAPFTFEDYEKIKVQRDVYKIYPMSSKSKETKLRRNSAPSVISQSSSSKKEAASIKKDTTAVFKPMSYKNARNESWIDTDIWDTEEENSFFDEDESFGGQGFYPKKEHQRDFV